MLITCKRKGSPDDAGRSEVNQASLFKGQLSDQIATTSHESSKTFPLFALLFLGSTSLALPPAGETNRNRPLLSKSLTQSHLDSVVTRQKPIKRCT